MARGNRFAVRAHGLARGEIFLRTREQILAPEVQNREAGYCDAARSFVNPAKPAYNRAYVIAFSTPDRLELSSRLLEHVSFRPGRIFTRRRLPAGMRTGGD